MIVKTGAALRGTRTYGLVHYLFGPGRANEHTDPRVIAGYRDIAELNPPARSDGRPGLDVRGLVADLDRPVIRRAEQHPDSPPVKHVFHTIISNRPDDPYLSDEQWADIAYDTMRELGLAGTEQGRRDIRWVAIRHDDAHIHLAGTLVRADGSVAHTPNDFKAAAVVRARMEAKYGLTRTNGGDRTASIRPTRAESEKATRQGRAETERETVRRLVRSAAGTARSAEEFRSELVASGVMFSPRRSTQDPKRVTGYKAALRPDLIRGDRHDGAPVWFAGGGLDKDLTWPKLCARWARDVRPGLDPAHESAVAAIPRVAPAEQAAMSSAERRAADRVTYAAEVAERATAMWQTELWSYTVAEALEGDPGLVDGVAAAAADAATITADLWQQDPDGRTTVTGPVAAADLAQRAGRTPGGGAPVHGPRAALLRTAVRAMSQAGQLSSDSDTARWLAMAVQVAAMLDAVADARMAQQRADQAEAARAAAVGFRAHIALAGTDLRGAGAPLLVVAVHDAAARAATHATAAQTAVRQRSAAAEHRPTPLPPTPRRTR